MNLPVIAQPGSPLASWPDKWLPRVPPVPPAPPTPLERVPFTFASGTLILQALTVGQILTFAQVNVTALFGAGSTILLGTVEDPNAFLDVVDVSQLPLGSVVMTGVVEILVPDFLILTVSAVGASGTGTLYYGVGT